MTNNKQIKTEILDVLDSFLVILTLHSPQNAYKIKTIESQDKIVFEMFERNNFLLNVNLEKENIIVTLNKNRFPTGIVFHYKLRDYEIESRYFDNNDSRSTFSWKKFHSTPIWTIKSNDSKMLMDVINVINKKINTVIL